MYAQLVSRLMVWETILPNWEKACSSSVSVVLLFNCRETSFGVVGTREKSRSMPGKGCTDGQIVHGMQLCTQSACNDTL